MLVRIARRLLNVCAEVWHDDASSCIVPVMTSPRSRIQEELQQARAFDNPREEVFLATLRTGALLKRPAAKVVEEHGLSLAQYNVLRILRGAGESGLPTLTIRERMIEEAAGITRLVDKLEGAGLVRRERGASADRRQVFCRITDAGNALLVRLDPLVNTAVNAVLVDVSEEQLQALLVLLDDVRASARAASDPPAGGHCDNGTEAGVVPPALP